MKHKLVVITNGNYFARVILDRLFAERGNEIAGVLVVTGDYSGLAGIASLRNVGAKTSSVYVAFKVAQLATFKLARVLFSGALLDVEALAGAYGVPSLALPKVDAPEALAFIASCVPDLIVSVSCPQRIEAPILRAARLGSINIHASLLPSFAGLAPYFWVLSRGEAETGISVHYMTDRFDEGNLLAQYRLAVRPRVSAFALFLELARLGSDALVAGVERSLRGEAGEAQDPRRRSYFSHPTSEAYRDLRRNGFLLARPGEIVSAIVKEVRRPPRKDVWSRPTGASSR
jgi:folate-dependent phosphoribosylglycinamide formyltransferase PurN